MPAGPALGRVEAKRRALTTPSTAPASETRWCQARNPTRRMRRSSRKNCRSGEPDSRADHRLPFPANLDTIRCTRAARSSGACCALMAATRDTTNAGVNDPVAALWGHRQCRTPGSFTPALVLRLRHWSRLRRRHKAPPSGHVRPMSWRQKRLNAVRGHGATKGERTSGEGPGIGGPT